MMAGVKSVTSSCAENTESTGFIYSMKMVGHS